MDAKHALNTTWQQLHSLPVDDHGQTRRYYAMADGQAHSHLHAHLQSYEQPRYRLFEHDDLPADQSPWLFPLTPNNTFSDWYLQESAGHYWGVVLSSTLSLVALGAHLKAFLVAQDEVGVLQLLRLYDPRVLPAFLSVLTPQQRHDFWQPLQCCWLDEPGEPLFWRQYHSAAQDFHATRILRLPFNDREEATV